MKQYTKGLRYNEKLNASSNSNKKVTIDHTEMTPMLTNSKYLKAAVIEMLY